MKRIKKIILISFLSFIFFSGCIEIQTVINVNPDGSGTVEETVLMSSYIMSMITGFAESFPGDSTQPAEKFSLFKEEELKSKAAEFGKGVTYISGEELKKDGREGYKAVYSFRDLNGVVINQNPQKKVSVMPGEYDQSEEAENNNNNVTFTFHEGDPSVLTINFPEKTDDEEEGESSDSLNLQTENADTAGFAQLISLMSDFRFAVEVNVNGSILETNASYVNGSKITLLDVNFGELIKNKDKLEELKELDVQSMEEVKKILSNVNGIKIEMNKPVMVKLK